MLAWLALVRRFARGVLLVLAGAVLMIGSHVTASATEAREGPDNAFAVETIIVPVDGMSCVACAATVKKAVKSLAGVSNVKVNLAAGTATVTFAPDKLSPDRIVAAIDKAGYKAGTPRKAE